MTDASLYSYWIFARVVIRNMLSALVLPRVCVDCDLSEIGVECDKSSVCIVEQQSESLQALRAVDGHSRMPTIRTTDPLVNMTRSSGVGLSLMAQAMLLRGVWLHNDLMGQWGYARKKGSPRWTTSVLWVRARPSLLKGKPSKMWVVYFKDFLKIKVLDHV